MIYVIAKDFLTAKYFMCKMGCGCKYTYVDNTDMLYGLKEPTVYVVGDLQYIKGYDNYINHLRERNASIFFINKR